jgi:hypothetical protein
VTSNADRSLIAHLLRRIGFGASGPEIDAAAAAGYAATVDGLFASADDPGVDATPAPSLPAAIDKTADAELVAWWLARMTAARNPLDAEGSTAKAPNENLARESMELFSLGVGHYTETDVRQAALTLTGWRLDRVTGAASFVPGHHAPGPETILGRTASFDIDSFTDLVLAQPASPEFVVARHWFRLGSASAIPAAT